jgi:hypothetical protein
MGKQFLHEACRLMGCGVPGAGILLSHRRENFKSYNSCTSHGISMAILVLLVGGEENESHNSVIMAADNSRPVSFTVNE